MGENTAKHEVADLAGKAAGGDRRAFRALVDRTHRTVYRVALRILDDSAGAEDVVQETYVRAWRGLAKIRDPLAAYGWICRIARNVATDQLRARGRKKALSLDLPVGEGRSPLVELLVHPAAGPERRMGDAEVARAVREAIASLKEKHRLVLTLRELDGMSYEELAIALGCSLGTVESRLHRARKALARKLRGLNAELSRRPQE
jgi:RNA polymerase sigma-70 factor, ECF subfamily